MIDEGIFFSFLIIIVIILSLFIGNIIDEHFNKKEYETIIEEHNRLRKKIDELIVELEKIL